MKKKTLITFSLLILTAIMLSCCSTKQNQNIVININQNNNKPKISLTFFGFKYETLNVIAIENTLMKYMDKHPNTSIYYDGIKSPEYFEVLEKRITTGNSNDIFMVDHERALELRQNGKLADLSDLSTLDNFSHLAKSQMTADNVIDYIPTSISAFGLYCNIDLLKKHGQKLPENLAEFEQVCDYFISKGITPIVSNNDISLKTIVIAKSMLPIYQNEQSIKQIELLNNGQIDLAETLRPGFEMVEYILKRGWVDKEEALNTNKTKDDLVIFANGSNPFMLTGVWAVPRLRELNPNFEFKVLPYPIMEDGYVLVINVDTRISINANSNNIEEAKRFVEFMTQKDIIWEFVNSQSSFSPLKENRLAEDKAIQAIGPYLNNGRSVLGADDNLKFPIWDMTRQCVVDMLKGDNSQAAVEHMRKQINEWKDLNEGDENL